MIQRTAQFQPWYHRPLPRCDTLIGLDKEQCVFSARYTDTDGRGIHLCKTHANMVDFPVKLIRPARVILR
jgi:hypothetical protein